MNKICYYYFILEPYKERLAEAEFKANWEISIVTSDKLIIKMAFLSYLDNNPAAIRFMIPNVQEQNIPDHYLNIVQESKEHFLSIYRLNFDRDAHFAFRLMTYVEPNTPPPLDISTKITLGFPNTESIRNNFQASFPHRHSLKLISDGQDYRIPLQYRYLSLFLFLEEEFKISGKWDYPKAHSTLAPYYESLKSLGHVKKPLSTFMDFRDRCAHIKSNNDVRGITQLSNKDAGAIEKIIPILTDVCASILNEKTGENFKIAKRSDAIQNIES